MAEAERRHTISVLVENEPGVLARVIGLFAGRGYNIESLTVAEVDPGRHLSRINIVTTGTEFVIEQIKALLAKLVPVHTVQDLTVLGPHVERELALVKVTGDRERLIEALQDRRLHARAPGRQHAGLPRLRGHRHARRAGRLHRARPAGRGQPGGVVAIGRGATDPRGQGRGLSRPTSC